MALTPGCLSLFLCTMGVLREDEMSASTPVGVTVPLGTFFALKNQRIFFPTDF